MNSENDINKEVGINNLVRFLKHGIKHLNKGGDFNYQVAMLCIDVSVELSIKTHLNIDYYISNFDKLLKLFKNGPLPKGFLLNKLNGIKSLRNKRNKVQHNVMKDDLSQKIVMSYASISRYLISKLFSRDEKHLFYKINEDLRLIDDFLGFWENIEERIKIFHLDLSNIYPVDMDFDKILNTLRFNEYTEVITEEDSKKLMKIKDLELYLMESPEKLSWAELKNYISYLKKLEVKISKNIDIYYENEVAYFKKGH